MRTANIRLFCLYRQWALVLACLVATVSARGDFSTDLHNAVDPLRAGVPEVVVVRLQSLLETDLPVEQWRLAAQQLAEALLAEGRPAERLALLGVSKFTPWAEVEF